MKTILASKSPRRIEILSSLGVNFVSEPADIDESVSSDMTPEQAAKDISRKKALAVLEKHKGQEVLVISADTVVAVDNDIIGKPQNKAHAFTILNRLSGRVHRVLTGFTICRNDKIYTDVASTTVHFKKLTDVEILQYIETSEPMDKAGAYGIQDNGALFVRKIEGEYFNVVGFPTFKVFEVLQKYFNITVDDLK